LWNMFIVVTYYTNNFFESNNELFWVHITIGTYYSYVE